MNIVSVTWNYADCFGGTTEAVRQFASALESPVISFTGRDLLNRCVRGPGVLHVPAAGAGVYGWPDRAGLRAAEELLRGADFVFCHMLFRCHDDWVRRMAARCRIPYCVVPHGALDPYVFTYRALRKRVWLASLGARLLRGSAGIVYATAREREKAARFASGVRSWVIPWPVPQPPAGGRDEARRRARERLGIGPADRVLLSLGRLHSVKRPREVIEAFGRAAGPTSHLVLAGPADEYSPEELSEYARSVDAPRVHLPGAAYGDAKWDFFHAADAFVSLSQKENFGYSVTEALAAGLPVLLSPGNDLASELGNVGCGWMLAGDGQEEAAAAIGSVLAASDEQLRGMGERGRAWAAAHTGIERFRAQLAAVAEAAVSDGRSRRLAPGLAEAVKL